MARHFPNWIRAYLDYTKYLEAPDSFHFWAGVSAIAGALRGKVFFDMGYFKWKPNFFIVYVAPPGIVAKSTSMGVALPLLRQVEDIHFGPDSMTWQGLTESFADAKQSYLLPDNTTYTECAITVSVSELGTFLDPTNRELIDVLVDLWDGRPVPWKRRTKGEGESEIVNPFFNLIGCTTPGWMAENVPEYAIQGGFTSRTVFLYADTKRHFSAYPKLELDRDKEVRALLPRLVEDLRTIAEIKGAYDMDAEAYEWGAHWYREHWQRPVSDGNNMAGYRARKQTHLHKLAMVIAAAQRDEPVIKLNDLVAADKIITALEPSMPEVFNAVSDNREVKCAALIVKMVRRAGAIDKQQCWKQLFQVMSYEEFGRGVNAAIAAGHIKEIANSTAVMLHSVSVDPPVGTVPEAPSRSADPSSADAPGASAA